MSGSEEVFQMETDVLDVADKVLSHDLLCVHLFIIDGYWIISNGNSKQNIVKLLNYDSIFYAIIVFGIFFYVSILSNIAISLTN